MENQGTRIKDLEITTQNMGDKITSQRNEIISQKDTIENLTKLFKSSLAETSKLQNEVKVLQDEIKVIRKENKVINTKLSLLNKTVTIAEKRSLSKDSIFSNTKKIEGISAKKNLLPRPSSF